MPSKKPQKKHKKTNPKGFKFSKQIPVNGNNIVDGNNVVTVDFGKLGYSSLHYQVIGGNFLSYEHETESESEIERKGKIKSYEYHPRYAQYREKINHFFQEKRSEIENQFNNNQIDNQTFLEKDTALNEEIEKLRDTIIQSAVPFEQLRKHRELVKAEESEVLEKIGQITNQMKPEIYETILTNEPFVWFDKVAGGNFSVVLVVPNHIKEKFLESRGVQDEQFFEPIKCLNYDAAIENALWLKEFSDFIYNSLGFEQLPDVKLFSSGRDFFGDFKEVPWEKVCKRKISIDNSQNIIKVLEDYHRLVRENKIEPIKELSKVDLSELY